MTDDTNDLSLYIIQNGRVRDLLTNPIDEQPGKVSRLVTELYTDLSFFLDPVKDFYSISIQGYNGLDFTIDPLLLNGRIDDDMKRTVERLDGKGTWIFEYLENGRTALSYIRLIKNPDRLSQRLGYLKISLLTEFIERGFPSGQGEEEGSFYLLDSNNLILASSLSSMAGNSLNGNLGGLLVSINKWERTKVDGKDSLVISSELENTPWTLLYTVPTESLLQDVERIRNFTFLLLALMILVSVLLSILFSIRFLSPLKDFVGFIKDLENENFDSRLTVHGKDELSLVAAAFNKTAGRLKELIQQVYLAGIKLKEAELSALQAQINPHFLYNTLDTIYWMCRLEKAFESGDLVKALSNMFRQTLGSGPDKLTTLKGEVSHLQSYMLIQQKRYGDHLKFELSMDDGILDTPVIKLLLQPLVENALIHGIDKKGGSGSVSVRIYVKESDLIYEVKDNGAGCTEMELYNYLDSELTSSKGLGIKNVNDRIRLKDGEGYGLSFSSRTGYGTTVRVRQFLHQEAVDG
jgi:two-component system sensor histidine kinase YesM